MNIYKSKFMVIPLLTAIIIYGVAYKFSLVEKEYILNYFTGFVSAYVVFVLVPIFLEKL